MAKESFSGTCGNCEMEIMHQNINVSWWDRSSRQEVFCKKGAIKNFANFSGNHLC